MNMQGFSRVFISGLLIAGISLSCKGANMSHGTVSLEPLKKIPAATWHKLGQSKIYFGHQSVGFNIIDGLELIKQSDPRFALKIQKISRPEELQTSMLAHSIVGENSDSQSKITAFAEFMDKGMGAKADIAFFKLCYVDIHRGSDPVAVFNEYRSTMAALKKKYPRVRFIHATVPLTATEPAWRRIIKSLMGKEDNNIRRQQYNELIRKEYGTKEPLFDIAAAESTYPDGTRSSGEKNGTTYYSLVPLYTDDGGHLNEQGKKAVAAELIKVLTEGMQGKK